VLCLDCASPFLFLGIAGDGSRQVDVGYAHVRFVLLVRHLCGEEEGGHDDQYAGSHNLLRMVEHSSQSVSAGGAPVGERVPHELPMYCNFLFHRRWRWAAIREEAQMGEGGTHHELGSSTAAM
jgi:hypothetical protein